MSEPTLRGPPASESMGLPARLLHTLFVLCATSLMLVIAVISFLFVLVFKSIMPASGPRRNTGRHVTFLESNTVITLPPSDPVAQRSPAKGSVPSLSLTATPRELEPQTPDGAEDPLRALTRICGFLTSNTARAWRGEDLAATPPLAGLAAYLDPVEEDLERISEMATEKRRELEKEKEIVGGAGGGSEVVVEAAAGESAGTGAGADADADAHDEPGLVRPDQAATHARPQSPTPPSPLTPPLPSTSTSTSVPTPTPTPTPPTSEPIAQHASVTPAEATATTTATPGPRKRKDAVLRTKRPSIDPGNADALANADDAAVRAAALLSRVTNLGAGLFDGAVRERGAALWTAFSRRGTPADVPVPPRPHTRFAAPAGERS